jgi:hypothetical protein
MNKYEYIKVLQGHYGNGWEDLTASASRKEILSNLRDYQLNEGGTYRIVSRRQSVNV